MRDGGSRFRWMAQAAGLLVAAALLLPVPASAVTFSPEVQAPLPPQFISAFGISLAASGSEVRLMFGGQFASLNGFDWGYATSHDGGATFASSRARFPEVMGGNPTTRVLALSDGSFAYLWTQPLGTLGVAVEEPGGNWRGPFTPLSSTTIDTDFDARALGTDLMIAWSDTSGGSASLRVGSFTGTGFRLASWQTVDDDNATVKADPRIRTHAGEEFLVWRRSNANGTRIFFSEGNLLSGWPAPIAVSGTRSFSEFTPDLAIRANGTVIVAFQDNSGTGFRVSGARAGPPYSEFQLFDLGAATGALLPSAAALAVDGTDRLLCAWLDGDPQTQTGGFRVMHAESADWSSFSVPVRVDSDPTQTSKDGPLLTVQGATAFLAWGDRREGTGTPRPYVVRGLARGSGDGPGAATAFLWVLVIGIAIAVIAIAVVFAVVSRSRRRRSPAAPTGGPAGSARPSVPPTGPMACPQCGTLNESTFRFCIRCGIPLAPPPGHGTRQDEVPYSTSK